MLHLRRKSPPEWLDHALAHLDQVLIDHAHCEKKAVATALSLLSSYPNNPALAASMVDLAEEEAGHLKQMVDILHSRGLQLGKDPGDPYAQKLMSHVRGGEFRLCDRLLVASIIEARSAERLKLLAENVQDAELASIYQELFEAEAGHFVLFFELARDLFGEEVARERLSELLDIEAELIRTMPVRAAMH